MPIRHGDMFASRASTWPRDHFCRSTMAPRRSRPITWNEFLPISMPIVAMVAIDLLDMAVLRLTLAPSQHHSPVGQEHGRTIPLADIPPSVELQASDPQLLTGYRHAETGVTHGERRKDASSTVMSVDPRTSPLRQPRLAQPVKTGLDILGVLVDGHAFPTFNRESGVDPQHVHGLFPGLLKLSRLRTGKR